MAPLLMQLLREKSRSTIIYFLFAILIIVFVFTFNTSGSGGCGGSNPLTETQATVDGFEVDLGLYATAMQLSDGRDSTTNRTQDDGFEMSRFPGLSKDLNKMRGAWFVGARLMLPLDSPAFGTAPEARHSGFRRPTTAKDQVKRIRVMNDLIETFVVAREAQRMGLRVSDTEIHERILSDSFYDPDTKEFKKENLRSYLRNLGISPERYQLFVGNELLREKMVDIIASLVTVPKDEVEAMYRDVYEQVRVEYVMVDSKTIAPIAPIGPTEIAAAKANAAAMKAYYDAHISDYVQPATVNVRAILVKANSAATIAETKDPAAKKKLTEERAAAQKKADSLYARLSIPSTPTMLLPPGGPGQPGPPPEKKEPPKPETKTPPPTPETKTPPPVKVPPPVKTPPATPETKTPPPVKVTPPPVKVTPPPVKVTPPPVKVPPPVKTPPPTPETKTPPPVKVTPPPVKVPPPVKTPPPTVTPPPINVAPPVKTPPIRKAPPVQAPPVDPFEEAKKRFTALARTDSDGEKKAQGGEYAGALTKEDLVDYFGEKPAAVALALKKGESSAVVEGKGGFWLFFADDADAGKKVAQAEAADEIAVEVAKLEKSKTWAKEVAEQIRKAAAAAPKKPLTEIVATWNEAHRPADSKPEPPTKPGAPPQQEPPGTGADVHSPEPVNIKKVTDPPSKFVVPAPKKPEPTVAPTPKKPEPTVAPTPKKPEGTGAPAVKQPAGGDTGANPDRIPGTIEDVPEKPEAKPVVPFDGMLTALTNQAASQLTESKFLLTEMFAYPRDRDPALPTTDDDTEFNALDEKWAEIKPFPAEREVFHTVFSLTTEKPIAGKVFTDTDGKRHYVIRFVERIVPDEAEAEKNRRRVYRRLLGMRQREAYRAWYKDVLDKIVKDKELSFGESWQAGVEEAWKSYTDSVRPPIQVETTTIEPKKAPTPPPAAP